MTYAYRFPDEATWLAAAEAEGLMAETEDGPALMAYTHNHAIGVIGTIWEQPDLEAPPVAIPGWHVNSTIAPEAWDPYLVVVNSPAVMFAGAPGPFPEEAILSQIEVLP
jgi:hypothetical protein